MAKTQKPAKAEEPKEPKKPEELSKAEKKEVKVIGQIIESKELVPQDTFGKLNRSQIELIKRTIAKGSTDDELRLFVQVCKGAQLNPFLRQVHLVKRWDSKEGREVAIIQVSIDGFRSIAESSKAYAGNDDPVFGGENLIKIVINKEIREITVPAKATVTVYKVVEGQRYPFTATARWSEYYPGEKIGFQWHRMPYLMLGKCAEALALRKAFPKLLSGMYTHEEMDQGMTAEIEQQRTQKAFETLLGVIKKANPKELEEYKSKMEKSDKYSKQQKVEFLKMVEARMKEIWDEKAKEIKKDNEKKDVNS